jgi:hypothetical protein
MKAHYSAAKDHHGALKAHYGAVEAQLGTMEANHGGNHHRFPVSETATKKLGRFKRRYNEFVPVLEDDQMM